MLIFHALARRLRDFDFEVFFFGTATVWQYYTLSGWAPPHGMAGLGRRAYQPLACLG
jgi:hypothetical protein